MFFIREKKGEKVFFGIYVKSGMEEVVLDGAVICWGYQGFPVAVLIRRCSELCMK